MIAGAVVETRGKKSLRLRKAIEIALTNNPEVVARGWDYSATQARLKQSFGERLPKLSILGGYTHHLDGQRLIAKSKEVDPGLFTRDIFSADVFLSLSLFTGGRLINQVKAAELLQKAAEHRLSRTREELVFNISSVFFSILAQRHVIESLEYSLNTLEEHVNRINALIEMRKAAKVDRMRTEVRLADVRQKLVLEKNLMGIQHRVLSNLLGIKDQFENISLEGELELQEEVVVPEFASAFDKALKERDDYLEAKAAFDAQTRNVNAARARHWPTISLQGSYGERWAAGSSTGTGDESGDVGRIGVAIEVPLFEGGRINARVHEQLTILAAAKERLRKLELQIRLEIETALANVKSSKERVNAIRKSITQARENLRIEKQKYNLGRGSIVDVLDAQSALLESETTYYQVLSDLRIAKAKLRLAEGEE